MGIISSSLKKKIDSNWDKLKCTEVGHLLQMAGIASGNSSTTSANCKSSSFNSSFSKNISQYTGKMNAFSSILEGLNKEVNSVKSTISSIRKSLFESLQKVATKIFVLYATIANIFVIMMNHLKNILYIFKYSLNTSIGLFSIIGSLINIIRKPINWVLRFV
jgi:phage-related minor tail protein